MGPDHRTEPGNQGEDTGQERQDHETRRQNHRPEDRRERDMTVEPEENIRV